MWEMAQLATPECNTGKRMVKQANKSARHTEIRAEIASLDAWCHIAPSLRRSVIETPSLSSCRVLPMI